MCKLSRQTLEVEYKGHTVVTTQPRITLQPAALWRYFTFFSFSYATAYNSAYGANGYQYMRNYDPSYDSFFTEGPTVDDKWRSTYPYVPTSFSHHNSGKPFSLKYG